MNFLKKLRLQIVALVVVLMTVFLAVMITSVLYWISSSERKKSMCFVEMLVENGGHRPLPDFPPAGNEKKTMRGPPYGNILEFGRCDSFIIEVKSDDDFRNYFSVLLSSSGGVIEVINDFPLNMTRDEVFVFVRKVLDVANQSPETVKGRKRIGHLDGFVYCVLENLDGTLLVGVVNRRSELSTIFLMTKGAFYVFLFSILFALVVSLILSHVIVKPVGGAFQKQRQFIADASHELKTPIAVIGANLDVLLPDMPDNRWLNYIKNENERMGHLVKNLLYLAKNEADRIEMQCSKFDFSSAVTNAILPFESVIFEQQKRLEMDIQEKIEFVGDEHQIKQIAVILVDNAVKNSDEHALIKVSAKVEKEKIVFKVYNTGHGIKKEDLKKIFLRFYRSDVSRARKTGGYGLGLSIAKAVAVAHHGSLYAESEFGQWAEFTLVLPLHSARLRLF